WKATARAASAGNQFGIANATARTKKPLIVRLQAPRFFVAGDSVTISGVVNNNTDAPLRVDASLGAQGVELTGDARKAPVDVPAGGEARLDWTVSARQAGEAKLSVTA